MKEPSKWAIVAAEEVCGWGGLVPEEVPTMAGFIQKAIDAACAERLNAITVLMETVPHNHHVPVPPGTIVSSDCPRCRFEALKKGWAK